MQSVQKNSTSLFEVYLRLRPPVVSGTERFLDVEDAVDGQHTHITIKPPTNDYRKRAVEKFGFTKVFEEDATQRDIFVGTTVVSLIQGVLGQEGKMAKDALLATLGVTGSGKSHTILGSKSHRGLTQMTLEVLFASVGDHLTQHSDILPELAACEVSEGHLIAATNFLDSIYGGGDSRMTSRAATPMPVSDSQSRTPYHRSLRICTRPLGLSAFVPLSGEQGWSTVRPVSGFARITRTLAKFGYTNIKDTNPLSIYPPLTPRRGLPRPSGLPQLPSVDDIRIAADKDFSYAIVMSMYEVYNDRIYDLLTASAISKTAAHARRRPLLFKSTEYSPDRKVVAGLRKIVCGNLDEALLVLETGLMERRIAGTGSNAVSSRSHGFFCFEVKKKSKAGTGSWMSNTMTIVDLAGSERARTANTAGATLAEAGKINESLMYLGQCMQMQSDNSNLGAESSNPLASTKPALVPFRQCKLTELLFSNSFHASTSSAPKHQTQKAIMIVTADPCGDFNATSQILRYSALAREVTVPRIPSVTSTIISGTTACASTSANTSIRPNTATSISLTQGSGRTTPASAGEESQGVEQLMAELAILRLELSEETRRRKAAEAFWTEAERRADEMEAEVRHECWSEFEVRLEIEKERWRVAWEDEQERGQAHLDSKLEILTRGICIAKDDGVEADGGDAETNEKLEELRRDNEVLNEKIRMLEREKGSRTPSRKMKVLKPRKWIVDGGDQENISP